jgi:hypothetical protein
MIQEYVLCGWLILAYNEFMSESRQRFTGRMLLGLIWVGFLWMVFVTLPLFTNNLQVTPMDPRWLTPEDLTWKRLVFNAFTKPGIRLMLSGGVGLLLLIMWQGSSQMWNRRKSMVRVRYPKTSFTLEWVMDGARKSSLSEYGKLVGAI